LIRRKLKDKKGEPHAQLQLLTGGFPSILNGNASELSGESDFSTARNWFVATAN
jgi:hypothetical protein